MFVAGELMSAMWCIADLARTRRDFRVVPILLQKSLAISVNGDSVALMRFAMEAIDDGAAQSRPR
jgi:hypothetical protein